MLCLTCGEKKIYSTVKKSQNIMNMVNKIAITFNYKDENVDVEIMPYRP